MGKIEEVRELSAQIYSTRSTSDQLHMLIEILVTVAKATKYEYDVFEAVKAYNSKAEWANSTGVNNFPIYEFESK